MPPLRRVAELASEGARPGEAQAAPLRRGRRGQRQEQVLLHAVEVEPPRDGAGAARGDLEAGECSGQASHKEAVLQPVRVPRPKRRPRRIVSETSRRHEMLWRAQRYARGTLGPTDQALANVVLLTRHLAEPSRCILRNGRHRRVKAGRRHAADGRLPRFRLAVAGSVREAALLLEPTEQLVGGVGRLSAGLPSGGCQAGRHGAVPAERRGRRATAPDAAECSRRCSTLP